MKISELPKTLKQDGWFEVTQSGSHIKMKHPSKGGIIIMPNHGSKELGKGLQIKILKDAGLK